MPPAKPWCINGNRDSERRRPSCGDASSNWKAGQPHVEVRLTLRRYAGTISSALLSRPYNLRRVALTPGTRLGVYDITAPIGEGGMGQVYRATDTTLGRQVAIKILPDAFASDPDRLARFEREAKTLASLNQSLSLMGLPL